MTIHCLADRGQSGRAIARMLGVSEGTVRYHLSREGVEDGRTHQKQLANVGRNAAEIYIVLSVW